MNLNIFHWILPRPKDLSCLPSFYSSFSVTGSQQFTHLYHLRHSRRNIWDKADTVYQNSSFMNIKSSECVCVCVGEKLSAVIILRATLITQASSEFSPPQVMTPRTSGSPKPASEGSSSTDCVTIQVVFSVCSFPQYCQIKEAALYRQAMSWMMMMVLKV